ncbi:hypothetical protein A2U01_0086375 [Trifolium medium]|uniref:Uncharacterized protein n=1 Tax=Trifolium medium TaxID=97028 RepID=A0A392TXC3_9FABA|nr:hypothetical protein [Trifolium medium]
MNLIDDAGNSFSSASGAARREGWRNAPLSTRSGWKALFVAQRAGMPGAVYMLLLVLFSRKEGE